MRALAVLAAIVVAYLAWMSRPDPAEHPEAIDICTFPTITNERYRNLIAEAKRIVDPQRREIWNASALGDGNYYSNAVISQLLRSFMAQSPNTEETFVRFHAFGRAFGGHLTWLSANANNIPSAEATITTFDRHSGKIVHPYIVLSGGFQVSPGHFKRTWADWMFGRLWGRWYDFITLSIEYSKPLSAEDHNLALSGNSIKHVEFNSQILFSPLNDMRWGDRYFKNQCPDTMGAIARFDNRLKNQGK